MLYVRLTIKVKAGIPELFKVGWYPHKITGSSHLNRARVLLNTDKATPFCAIINHCRWLVIYEDKMCGYF